MSNPVPASDPAALLRRLEEICQMYSYGPHTATEELKQIVPDLIPVVRRAVELEGENAELRRTKQGHDQPCYYCGEPCNALAGNPGLWPLPLCHRDEPGVTKWHHTRCVHKRLTDLSTARESAASALESLGLTAGPDPVAELAAAVPGMVVKMREAIRYWSFCTRQGMLKWCPEKDSELTEFLRAMGIYPEAALARETTNG